MTGVQTCALPICFPVTISGVEELKRRIAELREKEIVNEKALTCIKNNPVVFKLQEIIRILQEIEYFIFSEIREDESCIPHMLALKAHVQEALKQIMRDAK